MNTIAKDLKTVNTLRVHSRLTITTFMLCIITHQVMLAHPFMNGALRAAGAHLGGFNAELNITHCVAICSLQGLGRVFEDYGKVIAAIKIKIPMPFIELQNDPIHRFVVDFDITHALITIFMKHAVQFLAGYTLTYYSIKAIKERQAHWKKYGQNVINRLYTLTAHIPLATPSKTLGTQPIPPAI